VREGKEGWVLRWGTETGGGARKGSIAFVRLSKRCLRPKETGRASSEQGLKIGTDILSVEGMEVENGQRKKGRKEKDLQG